MSDANIQPKIPEEAVEIGLRKAIRSAIQASNIPDVKISCWWLPDEFDEDEVKARVPPYVLIEASPAGTPGFKSNLRDIAVNLTCVTLPDTDIDAAGITIRDLYPVVRAVIDAGAFVFPSPVKAQGGFTIDGGTVSNVEVSTGKYFAMAGMTINFKVSV